MWCFTNFSPLSVSREIRIIWDTGLKGKFQGCTPENPNKSPRKDPENI